MIGIYKITNLLNGKSYIGQSVHIERRWIEHCLPSKSSIISKAIQQYGKNNFKFEVLEECSKNQLNQRENFWIQYYNTLTPNGYNIAEDTESVHTTYCYYDKEILFSIIEDLKHSNLTFKQIGEKYHLNSSTISRINSGMIHVQEGLIYPIRITQKNTSKNLIQKTCIDCGKKICNNSIRCNNCNNKYKTIPLEKMKVSREELKQLIRTTSFLQIGKQFQVSDNTIRKWCKKYNLPTSKKEIKSFNDEEWQKI